MDEPINMLEICIHQARNIHNICIYHDQDVYAKIFSIDKPENKISTSVINGGGQNPVFNETLRFAIQTIESSLRFEVWMMSRIKNYLEDQMLGFTTLPLCDIISYSGKPAREFELSSSEVFHSPAGFIELSFKSNIEIPVETSTRKSKALVADVATSGNISLELEKVEFPDEVMENELERMASEYLSRPCDDRENDDVIKPRVISSTTESKALVADVATSGNISLELDKVEFPDEVMESELERMASEYLTRPCDDRENDDVIKPRVISSTTESKALVADVATSGNISLELDKVEFPDEVMENELEMASEYLSRPCDDRENDDVIKPRVIPRTDSASCDASSMDSNARRIVEEEIVDMYMKSMQEFSDALAKMKLPIDEKGTTNIEECGSNGKSKKTRVFYGSRAFF